jgi:hypothetical protein
MANENRDDFSSKTVNALRLRAAFICSNPTCRKLTIAPSESNDNDYIIIGTAAHICAAAPDGPRYNTNMTSEERKSISNGIYLCTNCSQMIDKNKGADYSVSRLYEWKGIHEEWVSANLNKKIADNNNTINQSIGQQGGITGNIVVDKMYMTPPELDRRIKHDIKIFEDGEKIFNEKYLMIIIHNINTLAAISLEAYEMLEEFISYYEQESHKYLDIELEQLKCVLHDKAIKFKSFLDLYFAKSLRYFDEDFGEISPACHLKGQQTPIYLLEKDMFFLNLKKSYSEFRKLIKQTLFI